MHAQFSSSFSAIANINFLHSGHIGCAVCSALGGGSAWSNPRTASSLAITVGNVTDPSIEPPKPRSIGGSSSTVPERKKKNPQECTNIFSGCGGCGKKRILWSWASFCCRLYTYCKSLQVARQENVLPAADELWSKTHSLEGECAFKTAGRFINLLHIHSCQLHPTAPPSQNDRC